MATSLVKYQLFADVKYARSDTPSTPISTAILASSMTSYVSENLVVG